MGVLHILMVNGGFVFAFGEGEGTVVYTLIQVFNNPAGVPWMDI